MSLPWGGTTLAWSGEGGTELDLETGQPGTEADGGRAELDAINLPPRDSVFRLTNT